MLGRTLLGRNLVAKLQPELLLDILDFLFHLLLGTHLFGKTSSVLQGELGFGASQADLEALDLAEPAFRLGFGDSGDQVVADVDQP